LRALPKARLGAVAYLEAYIDFVKPKLVLSRSDNNHTLWQLKRRPDVTYQVALVQNGWRIPDSPGGETNLIGTLGFEKVDTYFSLGRASRASFESKLDIHFVEIGSLRLNNFPNCLLHDVNGLAISLISIFRPGRTDSNQGISELANLKTYLVKNEIDLQIMGSQISAVGVEEEMRFYEKAIPRDRFTLSRRTDANSSYTKLSPKSIYIADQSTLGYEALALGLRVGFISFQPPFRLTDRFGKPLEFGEKGPFWTNDPSEEEIGRILDYLLSVSDEQWERDSGWIRDQLMVHDYGNTKIRAYVEGVLTDSLENK